MDQKKTARPEPKGTARPTTKAKTPASPAPYKKPAAKRRPVPQAPAAVVAADNSIADTAALPFNRTPYYILLAAGIVVLGCAAALALMSHDHMSGPEHRIFTTINGVSLPHFVTAQVARPLSDAVWGILGLIVIFLIIPRFRVRAWQYAAAAGSTYVFASIVERIIDRGRPAVLTHDAVLRATQGGPGFPSGHVSVLSALCLTVWLFVSWPWRVLLVLLVIAEAWSRIFLGVHSPLDVLGAVGAACIVVSVIHLIPAKLKHWFKLMER